MRRVLLISLLLAAALFCCKKETETSSAVDADTLQQPAPDSIIIPPKEKPVILAEEDIAPFIAHFPAVNDIGRRYDAEMSTGEKNPGVVRSEGQVAMRAHLKEQGVADPSLFMRKAAKLIRGWIGLKMGKDPAVLERRFAAIAAQIPAGEKRAKRELEARQSLDRAVRKHLRILSADEKALIERHYDELAVVLNDIPVDF